MFTGIVESTATIAKIIATGSNKIFWMNSTLAGELKIDQSVSHNGVCLTVDAIADGAYSVTAIEETLQKTTLGNLAEGDIVNLERCMVMNGRLDGHMVQGHVDTTALCTEISEKEGSWVFSFTIPAEFSTMIVEKGSVCLNGISLTIFDVGPDCFSVAIIPYTYEHTSINNLKKGDRVNIEFDIVGKYIVNYMNKKMGINFSANL